MTDDQSSLPTGDGGSAATVWLRQRLAQELGAARAEALWLEYKARQAAQRRQEAGARATADLPALRQQLIQALQAGKAGEVTKYRAMIAKRERLVAEAEGAGSATSSP